MSAFSEMPRLTILSLSTSRAASSRFSVEERISIVSSSRSIDGLGPLEVEPRADLAPGLVERVGDLGHVDLGHDVEGELIFAMARMVAVCRGERASGAGSLSCASPGGCPSGQRERSVKSPAKPTEVRILPLPLANSLTHRPNRLTRPLAHPLTEPTTNEPYNWATSVPTDQRGELVERRGFLLLVVMSDDGDPEPLEESNASEASPRARAVHLMTDTAVTGATFDIDRGQQLVPI